MKNKKAIAVLSLIFFFVVLILAGQILFRFFYPFPKEIKIGVTFSEKAAIGLNLDWKEIYIKVLDDLQVRNLRLESYWDEIEKNIGNFDFSNLDFMLDEAKKRDAKIILVVGMRQPRWPECHIPAWAKKISVKDRQSKTLEFISKVVDRYKDNNQISSWQVENEPFLSSFGQGCDKPDASFLKKEVELVKSLSSKPIILTDSGELGSWITPMAESNIFGTTLYREVYNQFIGYTTYPLPAYLYNIKSQVVKNLFAKNNTKTIIIELQAEPWSGKNNLLKTPPSEQVNIFLPEEFDRNITFAKETGFSESYLWGVEWWYFMASQGYPEYVHQARKLFR